MDNGISEVVISAHSEDIRSPEGDIYTNIAAIYFTLCTATLCTALSCFARLLEKRLAVVVEDGFGE